VSAQNFDAGHRCGRYQCQVGIDKLKSPVSIAVARALRNWLIDDILLSRHKARYD
jgi:hypothetical protein